MNLNQQFKEAIIDNNYRYSVFDGKQHKIEDLQICHILSKSKRTLNSIKKAYNCSNKTAEIIMNMPLLNTVVGTIQDNKEYKKTDDIVYIDRRLLNLLDNIFIGTDDDGLIHCIKISNGQTAINSFLFAYEYLSSSSFNIFALPTFENYFSIKERQELECKIYTGVIKNIQHRFHKEIDLYI